MIGKGNDGKGNNSNRDDWETPDVLFNKLNKQYNFDFDCCATKENTKCELFSNQFHVSSDKLKYNNFVCWMNPPFSNAKLMFEHFFNSVRKGVAIYRCDNLETKIWQEIILPSCDWIFIPKGRIYYQYNTELRQGKGARFPSAFIGKGVGLPKFFDGIVLFPKIKELVEGVEK